MLLLFNFCFFFLIDSAKTIKNTIRNQDISIQQELYDNNFKEVTLDLNSSNLEDQLVNLNCKTPKKTARLLYNSKSINTPIEICFDHKGSIILLIF